ncbi:hypothetical protein SUGI_0890920 [Cryptomeria japonica]|nr:hypothetical protein SUGI_0890920 [Cryptomeria japonica]
MEGVDSDVKNYLLRQKKEYGKYLLREAARIDNAEMAWELLNRGADMGDILDPRWRGTLNSWEEKALKNVTSRTERMKEQGRHQPSMEDKLGRYVFAEGVAALLFNRFVESPITVGISGEWGMGNSSLMIQIEKILLITEAQLTFPNLLPSEQFGGAKKISLSTRGRQIYGQIKKGFHNLLSTDITKLVSWTTSSPTHPTNVDNAPLHRRLEQTMRRQSAAQCRSWPTCHRPITVPPCTIF